MKAFKVYVEGLMEKPYIIFVDCATVWVLDGEIVKITSDENCQAFIGCLLGIINDGEEIDFQKAIAEAYKCSSASSIIHLLEIIDRE